MNEFIEKLIGRLEERKAEHLHDEKVMQELEKNNLATFCSAKARALDDAIKIVNQLAEEYNGGWINADVESPTENGKYIVYYRKWTDGNYLPRFDETEIKILRYRTDGWFFPTYGDVEAEKDIHREVIAWQPLPEPFKPIAE